MSRYRSDLRARMPLQTCKGDDKVSKTIKTPMLANRMARDRMKFGIKAWDPKQGSDIKVFRMLQTMPEAVQRTLLQTNSTRHVNFFSLLPLFILASY